MVFPLEKLMACAFIGLDTEIASVEDSTAEEEEYEEEEGDEVDS